MRMTSRYDAILVPGGGVGPGGELPLWVRRRLDRAMQIHDREYLITLSAGTTHKPPPLDERGFPIFESIAAARYLVQRGVDAGKILTETSSYDTLGNAYFSRVIHVQPRDFKRLLVITSAFHMARTESIFMGVNRREERFLTVSELLLERVEQSACVLGRIGAADLEGFGERRADPRGVRCQKATVPASVTHTARSRV